MSKDRLTFIDCFEGRDKNEPLPVSIPLCRIGATITTHVEALIAEVNEKFASDLVQRKRQQNTGRLRAVETRLQENVIGDGKGSLRSLADVQRTYRKARQMIRDACMSHPEYKDRKMDVDVASALEKRFVDACTTLRAEIQAQFTAADGPADEARKKREIEQHILAMRALLISRLAVRVRQWTNAQQKPVVSNNETVNIDNFTLFSEFMFCLDEAVTAAGEHPQNLHTEAVRAVGNFCDDDLQKKKLFGTWLKTLLLERVDQETFRGADHQQKLVIADNDNGGHTPAESVLLPQKFEHLQRRKAPDDRAMWQMTQEELCVLRALYEERSKGQLTALEDDETFLAEAQQIVNARCSGGLPIVRAGLEIRRALNHFAAMEGNPPEATPIPPPPAIKAAPKPSEPTSPPPPPPAPKPYPPALPPHSEEIPPKSPAWDLLDPEAVLGLLDVISADCEGGREPLLTEALKNLHLPYWQYSQWVRERSDIEYCAALLNNRKGGGILRGRIPMFLRRLLLGRVHAECPGGEEPTDALLAQHGLTRARYERWAHPGARMKTSRRPRKPVPAPKSPWIRDSRRGASLGTITPVSAPEPVLAADSLPIPPIVLGEPVPTVLGASVITEADHMATPERPGTLPPDLQLISDLLDQREEILSLLLSEPGK
ncbi:hypothetical protein COU80_02025 [Candidatus Peregrinibacteria bacterium CG10_big_fil_rev_8_21_14_0_10_55_24]|nr:MAG: hypothetical protein COU80_02025 [Candidatus Peregrinibacteria bacterium CG10_big_fil_rev_8_21_14_0_10_55_24]